MVTEKEFVSSELGNTWKPGSFRSSLFQAISVTATISAIALCEDGPVRVARVPERSRSLSSAGRGDDFRYG